MQNTDAMYQQWRQSTALRIYDIFGLRKCLSRWNLKTLISMRGVMMFLSDAVDIWTYRTSALYSIWFSKTTSILGIARKHLWNSKVVQFSRPTQLHCTSHQRQGLDCNKRTLMKAGMVIIFQHFDSYCSHFHVCLWIYVYQYMHYDTYVFT